MRWSMAAGIILMVTAFAFWAHADESPQWITFTGPHDTFTVLFPAQPIVKHAWVQSSNGNRAMPQVTYVADTADTNMFVSIARLSTAPDYYGTPLGEAVADLSGDGKLLSSSAITVDGHGGRKLMIEQPGGKPLEAEIFVLGDILYRVVAAAPAKSGGDVGDEVNQFFASFHFTH